MKVGRALDVMVLCTAQFNLECCKNYEPNMGPNTIMKMIEIIKKLIKKLLTYNAHKNWQINVYDSPLHSIIQIFDLLVLLVKVESG